MKWTPLKAAIAASVVLAAGGALFKMTSPPNWRSEFIIFFPLAKSSQATMLPFFLGGGNQSMINALESILKTRKSFDRVAKECKIEDIKEVEGLLKFSKTKDETLLTISSENSDKAKSICALNTLQAYLRETDASLSLNEAGLKVKSLKESADLLKKQLETAHEDLKTFQEQMIRSGSDGSPTTPEESYAALLKKAEMQLAQATEKVNGIRAVAARVKQNGMTTVTGEPQIEAARMALKESERVLRELSITAAPSAPAYKRQQEAVRIARNQLSQAISEYVSSIESGTSPEIREFLIEKAVFEEQTQRLRTLAEKEPSIQVTAAEYRRTVEYLTLTLTQVEQQLALAEVDAKVSRQSWVIYQEPITYKEALPKGSARFAIMLGIIPWLLLAAYQIFVSKPAKVTPAEE